MERHQKIWNLTRSQHGLIARSQLGRLDVTRGQRRALVASERLEVVGRNTFRVVGTPATPRQTLLQACFDSGGSASHRSAAWLRARDPWGPGGEVPGPEIVVGRRSFDYALPGVRVHTTRWLPADHLVRVDGIPVTNVARTLFDLASLVPDELSAAALQGVVDDAVRDGLATDPWLWWMLEALRRRGRGGVSVFEAILDARSAGDVTHSWLERETYALLRAARLPLPVCQQRVRRQGSFVARVDFLYPDDRIVIEVSGAHWHKSARQQQIDQRRRRQLALEGYLVLEYTYDDVVNHPDRIVREVREALARRSAA